MASDWQLQEAKNRLSELVDRAASRGPQTITRHGKPAAVLLSVEDYERIKKDGSSLVQFFAKSPLRDIKLDLKRSRDTGRDVAL